MMPRVDASGGSRSSAATGARAGPEVRHVVQALRPVGARALLVEVDPPEAALALYRALQSARSEPPLAGVVDIVPGAASVLLDGLADRRAVAEWLRRLEVGLGDEVTAPAVVTMPVRYDGPDLSVVADAWGTSPEGAVARHTSLTHRVAFLGFAPGFAYLRGVPADRPVPRRSAPRPAVPAGSVAVAGAFTGIYPRSSPGGWQLIGRTDAWLFDPERDPPTLLAPGMAVRFEAVP